MRQAITPNVFLPRLSEQGTCSPPSCAACSDAFMIPGN